MTATSTSPPGAPQPAAGYLSRQFTFSPRNLRRLVTTVVVPYGGETLERLWLNPHWPSWYGLLPLPARSRAGQPATRAARAPSQHGRAAP